MKRLLSLTLAFLLVFGSAFEIQGASDLAGHFAQQHMESFMARGFINGFPDGTVRPNNPITRAEFYTLVNRAFGFMQLAPIGFSDVRPDAWYFQEISRAQAAGYILAGTQALPNQQITREEAAVVIHRISGLTPFEAGAGQFNDVPFAWTRPYIGAVVSAGFMQGFPDGSFRPHAPITRGEAVVVLTRAMNRVGGLDVSFIPPAEGNLNPLTFATPGQALPASVPRQSDFTNFVMTMTTSSMGGGQNDRRLSGSLLVDVASGSLRDMDIAGDLVFSERTNGNFTLTNVHVTGNIYIFGNPRIVLDNSFARELVVNSVRSGASVTLRRMSEIATARLFSGISLSEDVLGNRHLGFNDVIIEFGFAPGDRVLLAAHLNRITVNERSVVRLDRGHAMNVLIDANAERAVFELGPQASVDFAEINAMSVQFSGMGRIRMADVRASGVTFQRRPETLLGYQGAGWWGQGGGFGTPGFGWWNAPDWWLPGWWDTSGWWGSGSWWGGSNWGPDWWLGNSWHNQNWWGNNNWWGHPGWFHGSGWHGVGGTGDWDHHMRVRIVERGTTTPVPDAMVEISISHLGIRRSIGSGMTNLDGDVFPWLPTGWRGEIFITVRKDGYETVSAQSFNVSGQTLTVPITPVGTTTPPTSPTITITSTTPQVNTPVNGAQSSNVPLSVVANVTPSTAALTYRWYEGTTNNFDTAVVDSSVTTSSINVPIFTSDTVGSQLFFWVVVSSGSASQRVGPFIINVTAPAGGGNGGGNGQNGTTITALALGLTAPVAGAEPSTAVTGGTNSPAQWTATAAWFNSITGASAGAAFTNAAYTARVTITPASGFTLTGVANPGFTVAGASSVMRAGNIVDVRFPAGNGGTPVQPTSILRSVPAANVNPIEVAQGGTVALAVTLFPATATLPSGWNVAWTVNNSLAATVAVSPTNPLEATLSGVSATAGEGHVSAFAQLVNGQGANVGAQVPFVSRVVAASTTPTGITRSLPTGAENINLHVGGSTQAMSVSLTPAGITALPSGWSVYWSSAAPAVATVNAGANSLNATAAAVAPGTTNITAQLRNNGANEGTPVTFPITVPTQSPAVIGTLSLGFTQGGGGGETFDPALSGPFQATVPHNVTTLTVHATPGSGSIIQSISYGPTGSEHTPIFGDGGYSVNVDNLVGSGNTGSVIVTASGTGLATITRTIEVTRSAGPVQLSAPQNLRTVDRTRLEWDAVTNATGYRVYHGGTTLLANVTAPIVSIDVLESLIANTVSYTYDQAFNLTAVAIADGINFIDSQASSVFEYRIPAATGIVSATQGSQTNFSLDVGGSPLVLTVRPVGGAIPPAWGVRWTTTASPNFFTIINHVAISNTVTPGAMSGTTPDQVTATLYQTPNTPGTPGVGLIGTVTFNINVLPPSGGRALLTRGAAATQSDWAVPQATVASGSSGNSQSVAAALTSAQAAVNGLSVSNNTRAEDVMTAVNRAINNTNITASWHPNSGFTRIPAVARESGAIVGRINITDGVTTAEVVLSRTIPSLNTSSAINALARPGTP